MTKWKTIWNQDLKINLIPQKYDNRKSQYSKKEQDILNSLLVTNGFASNIGNFNSQNWLKYINIFFEKIGIKRNNSIFEVGCGTGAFIYPLYLRGNNVGGVDYSYPSIKLARKIFGSKKFFCEDALNIFPGSQFDVVLSHSVFQYFPNLNYAEKVVINMIKKSNNKVAILDINDASKEDLYHKIRGEKMGHENYKKKYEGLKHTFYRKGWFERIASKMDLNFEIFDQNFENYVNSKLRFNVIMEKK